MAAPHFLIYQSSAGSGKTYTLAKAYLGLALRRPSYYKHILAVTFTNKAMQEMKNRIIQKLSEFRQGKFDTMAREIMDEIGIPGKEFQNRCGELLVRILHGYSHFAISTIDSFFQKVIRGFAKELGLAGSYRLELDTDIVLIQVVDDLLNEATDNTQVRDWLIRFSRESLQEGGNWDVRRNIIQLAQEIFQEHFKAIEEEIVKQNKDLVGTLKKNLDQVIAAFEGKMSQLGQEGLEIVKKYGLTLADFTGGSRSPLNYLDRISRIASPKDFIPSKTVVELPAKPQWFTKTSTKAEAITAATENGLRDVLSQALDHYQTQFQSYYTAVQVKRFIYGYGLLADLARKLAEYKRENDVMLIQDATRFLKELVRDSDTPFVYEKIGSFFHHYLVDEFQDTSGFQWDSFKPLVEDSLAQGYENMVVGDIKQAIYRWRGGDWELLLHKIKEDIGAYQVEVKNLGTNFRSEANIIHFNNALFELAPIVMSNESSKENSPKWEVLQHVYSEAHQELPETTAQAALGYVNISFLEDEAGFSWKDLVADKLPKLIEELQDKNIALKEIAILVRRNKEGKDIADYLYQYTREHARAGYRYDVVSNESLFLSSSPAVRLIVSALKYLQDDKNKVIKAHMTYEYQRNIKARDIELHQVFGGQQVDHNELLPTDFLAGASHLISLPFYELVERLIDIFEVNTIQGQFAYLQTFQDLVLKFTQDEKGDIQSFLEWWEERGAKESIKVADDLDAIKILTIHKAKGLEFRSVIIPFCDWEIDHQRSPILWSKTKEAPFDVGYLPIKYQKGLEQTHFKQAYEEERMKAHLDSLNLLYVATTRAVHNLWVFAPNKKRNIAKVLYDTLDAYDFKLKEHWDHNKGVFELGQRDFVLDTTPPEMNDALVLDKYHHFNWRDKITVKQESKGFTTGKETRQKINDGILMHKLLGKIHYLQDVDLAIRAIQFEKGLSQAQKSQLETQIGELLSGQQAKKWFSDEWEVRNEWPILSGDYEYRPDRVITKGNKAIVIDYKTGIQKEQDKQQVRGYKKLLEEMGYEAVEGFLWYLEAKEVVEC
ncbi:MAG: UvrD-helicase domain-containing protein [Cytophagales bacterium]|nr:UvrD-helicase domain-containing protein [Cytophagales bacterium]